MISPKDNSYRHAYLVMCHNNFTHLCKLLLELDDSRNDIYIHVDKKVLDVPYDKIRNSIGKASLYFVSRTSVAWGGYSQIRAELTLLKEAIKTEHYYYHLISGADYPLKSQKYIHAYFKTYSGKEFIRYDCDSKRKAEFIDRVRYYYCFQELIGRNSGKIPALAYRVQDKLLFLQRRLKVDRTRHLKISIYKGTSWFSITHGMAVFLVENEKLISQLCRYGICADEIFVQTVAMRSPHKENIVDDSLRYIDWKRGNPYTFTLDDFETLKNTDKLFARKFDEKISEGLVDKLHEYISGQR